MKPFVNFSPTLFIEPIYTITVTSMHRENKNPSRKLINDEHHPVRFQACRFIATRSVDHKLSVIWPVNVSQDGLLPRNKDTNPNPESFKYLHRNTNIAARWIVLFYQGYSSSDSSDSSDSSAACCICVSQVLNERQEPITCDLFLARFMRISAALSRSIQPSHGSLRPVQAFD